MTLEVSDASIVIDTTNLGGDKFNLKYRVEVPVVAFNVPVDEALLRDIKKEVTARVRLAAANAANFDGKGVENMHCNIGLVDMNVAATQITSTTETENGSLMQGAKHVITGESEIFSLGGEKFSENEAISQVGANISWQVADMVAGCTRKMAFEGKLPMGELEGIRTA